MGIISAFAKHPVAANLMMLAMLLSGIWGLDRLNTQFFPNFELDLISVNVEWSGASAEDVELAITYPIEQVLRNVDNIKEMTSTSTRGRAVILLELEAGADSRTALDQVKEEVSQVKNLPTDSEPPVITEAVMYEVISRLILTGFADVDEVRYLIHDLEQSLLDNGFAKVDICGLPEEEITIQVPAEQLMALNMSLNDIGQKVSAQSQDAPAGIVGRDEAGRQLRSLEQRRDAYGFTDLIIDSDAAGRVIRLNDIAQVDQRPRENQALLQWQGQPAIELTVKRTTEQDALEAAYDFNNWVEQTENSLPPTLSLQEYDERWMYIDDRISLLVKNGIGGLLLVLAILFTFLNNRVALWVAIGIATAFFVTLAIMSLIGASINMISLFALIMVLGIIVDDAIVVGEETLTRFQKGDDALTAAVNASKRMFAPVFSSSLTTVAAFMPLMLVGGLIGNILFTIPQVVIIVIAASLIEAFLILPGHLHHSLKTYDVNQSRPFRDGVDARFNHFRENLFKPFVAWTLSHRATVISAALALLIFCFGLIFGGRVQFTFFPEPEPNLISANIHFASGTPPETVQAFVSDMESALWQANDELGGDLIHTALTRFNIAVSENNNSQEMGTQFGTINVELVDPDERDVRNPEIIAKWESLIPDVAGIEKLSIESLKSGPPGMDVDVQLIGDDPLLLKEAALELNEELRRYPGVFNVSDNLPYGQAQWIYQLTPVGESLGLTMDMISAQLRAAYDGHLTQIFYDKDDEIEVRVTLPDHERYHYKRFYTLPIFTPAGDAVPLENVVDISPYTGMRVLLHSQGELSAHVTAEVDSSVNNANLVVRTLSQNFLPEFASRHKIDYALRGASEDQMDMLNDMKRGALYGALLIYLILAWIFASYGMPLVIITAIPFGLSGAILGHWLLGIDLTTMSLFGFFGLSGIVINNAIILITAYQKFREDGLDIEAAIVAASCARLRAVVVTSATTIAGLTPLLFETSLQAQFLIPMAVSITFGLAFATVLVLVVIPSLLSVYEHGRANWPGQGKRILKQGMARCWRQLENWRAPKEKGDTVSPR